MTKIQKLLYIVYGVYLRVYEERLVDERPQAWPSGPVFSASRQKLLERDFAEVSMDDVPGDLLGDETLKFMVDFVFDPFATWNAGQLSEWSRQKGSPWGKTVDSPGFDWGDTISDGLIYDYFKGLVLVGEE